MIELNLVSTGIALIGTTIKNLSIENDIVDVERDGKRTFGININEPDFQRTFDDLYARIAIDIEVEIHQSENQFCKLRCSLEGAFLAENGVEENEFKKLVIVNGASALIGIARGKIEAITGNIFSNGKVVIPFVNVLDYYKSENL